MQTTANLKFAVQARGAGILVAIAMASLPVAAQGPSAAQASVVRQACHADYGANCAGVPTGGSAALACLQRSAAKTSPACQQALQAVAGSANATAPASAGSASTAAPAASSAAGTASNGPTRGVVATPVPSAAQPPEDTWPHTVTGPHGTATVYQPQVTSWPGFKTLNARTAFGILPEGAQAPTLGSIDVAFTTATSLEQRVVTLTEPRLVASRFPTLDPGRAAQVDERIRARSEAGGSRFEGFGQLEQDRGARTAGGARQHEFQSMRGGGGGFAGRGGGGFRR